jgi:hypothetical protein
LVAPYLEKAPQATRERWALMMPLAVRVALLWSLGADADEAHALYQLAAQRWST